MCIAAVVYKPVSLAYLEEMDKDNPHGGGVACKKEGRIWFLKGLDAKAIFALQEADVLTYPYLLHFRWATVGPKVAENCHPFVVGPRALMGETCGFAERVLIHNGSWGGYQAYIPLNSEIPDGVLKHVSDTAMAAWLLQDNPDILDEVPWATAHAEMVDGEMDITTRGTWTDHGGNWYSNLNWLPNSEQNWNKWWQSSTYARPAASAFKANPQRSVEAPAAKPELEKDPDLADMMSAGTFEDYIKAKYGEEIALLALDEDMEEVSTPRDNLADELADLDIVSEDNNLVNSFLARQMIKSA